MAIEMRNKELYSTRTERKFVFCSHCKETTVVDFEVEVYTFIFYSEFLQRDAEDVAIEYYRMDGTTRVAVANDYVAACPRCGEKKIERKNLKAKYSKKHVCGLDCQNATGSTCTCSCEGKNHGINHRLDMNNLVALMTEK